MHTMRKVGQDGDFEELECAECGRRVKLRWPPNYKKVTIQPGDPAVAHRYTRGGLTIGEPEVMTEEYRKWLEGDQ